MKKGLVFLMAMAAALSFSFPAHAAGPRISLSTENWDFGTVYQWANPTINITIKNTGAEDLKVLDVKASCGCTVAVLSDKMVKPGGSTVMRVDFSAYNYTGKVKKMVKLTTNDPASPEKLLNIHGVVLEEKGAVGYLEQTSLDLGVVAPYETKYFVLKVTNKGTIDLRLRGLDLPVGYFVDSSMPDTIPPRGDAFLKIGYRPAKLKGPINDEIKVQLANPRPDQEELRLKLAGYVAEPARGTDTVIVTPTLFKLAPGAKNPVLEVAVKNEGSGSVIIEGVESSLDTAGADTGGPEIAPGEAGKAHLTLKPDGLKAGTKGYLYLRLAVPVIVEGTENK